PRRKTIRIARASAGAGAAVAGAAAASSSPPTGTASDEAAVARRRERSRGAAPEAPSPGRSVGSRAAGPLPVDGPRPGPGRVAGPGRGGIRDPKGFTAQELAGFMDHRVDAGSREHYADPALYDYEYRRRRADVTFYRELARRRGADRILELGAGTGRVTVPLARDGRQIVAVDPPPAVVGRAGGGDARGRAGAG